MIYIKCGKINRFFLFLLFLLSFNFVFSSCSKDTKGPSSPRDENNGDGNSNGDDKAAYDKDDLENAISISLLDEKYSATPRANGFLFGITSNKPGDKFLNPLSIPAYRSNFKSDDKVFDRLNALGIQTEFVLGGYYGYPPSWGKFGSRPGENGDYSQWEDVVRDVVSSNMAKGRRGSEMQYDIWNEGDFHSYWDGSRANWLETWVKGAKIVRELDPGAKIIGPSFARFDLDGIIEFIQYADAHGVMPDILSWHEVERDFRDIEPHIESLRASSIKDKLPSRIHINEYGSKELIFTPGGIVNYIAPMDRSQIEAGLRGSFVDGAWGDYTLCGLLIDDEINNKLVPTPAYWTHKYYATLAEENNTMVAVGIEDSDIDGLLSYKGAQESYLLLGNAGKEDYSVPILLKDFKDIVGFEPSKVEVVTLPDNRYAFPDPVTVSKTNTLVVESGDVIFKADLPARGAIFVHLTK